MTTINRVTWTDDDGSGTTGTIINNARLQGDIYDKVDGALAALDAKDASQDTSITANGPHKILSANHTDSIAATLVAGDVLAADATGKLARLPAGANGTLLGVTSGLPAYNPQVKLDAAGAIFERGRAASIGDWIDVPFNAANFIAATGTWTMPAGNVLAYGYSLIGRTMLFNLVVQPSTTSAATASLTVKIPAPYTAARTIWQPIALVAGSGWATGLATVPAGGSNINLFNTGLTGFPASAAININVNVAIFLS
jgi:hypothetical protein